jgi:hypothetical protein
MSLHSVLGRPSAPPGLRAWPHWRSRAGAALAAVLAPVRGWGWPAAAGAALLLVAAGIDVLWVPHQEAVLATTQQHARSARARALAAARPVARGTATGDQADEPFRAALPAPHTRQQRLARLFDSAARAGLAVRRSEHRYGIEMPLEVARYRVALPLVGSYAGLRSFIQQALADDPALSLDSLRLVRPHATQAVVEAQLQFSLWLQATPPGEAAAAHLAQADRP